MALKIVFTKVEIKKNVSKIFLPAEVFLKFCAFSSSVIRSFPAISQN
ncbi:hypothetical protein D1AOALGA4SA_10513 [Olavius algarvensis Delta 1 endosymbiont]|nr:hypothetical protein D1AOALGA4SA_10513 [Olavius algarvensis Delta 1 endosymbiont]